MPRSAFFVALVLLATTSVGSVPAAETNLDNVLKHVFHGKPGTAFKLEKRDDDGRVYYPIDIPGLEIPETVNVIGERPPTEHPITLPFTPGAHPPAEPMTPGGVAAGDRGTAVGQKTSDGCTVVSAVKKGLYWTVKVKLKDKTAESGGNTLNRKTAEDQACSLLT